MRIANDKFRAYKDKDSYVFVKEPVERREPEPMTCKEFFSHLGSGLVWMLIGFVMVKCAVYLWRTL